MPRFTGGKVTTQSLMVSRGKAGLTHWVPCMLDGCCLSFFPSVSLGARPGQMRTAQRRQTVIAHGPGSNLASEDIRENFPARGPSCKKGMGRVGCRIRAWCPDLHLRSQPLEASDLCSWRSQPIIPTFPLGSSAHLVSFPVCKLGKILATSQGWCQN